MDTKFILVVEDDPILKNLLGHTLADKYKTVYASDGNEALALFEQHRPVLVLLDLMLPTMDGFAVLQAIRARTDELRDVPVVVVSNLGADADKQKARVLGANDYLIKAEVAVEEIVAKIQGLLPVDVVPVQSATVAADSNVAPVVLATGETPVDTQATVPVETSSAPAQVSPPPFVPMYGVGEGELPIQPTAPEQPVQPQVPSSQPPPAPPVV